MAPVLGSSGFVLRVLAALRRNSLSLSVTMKMLFSGSLLDYQNETYIIIYIYIYIYIYIERERERERECNNNNNKMSLHVCILNF